MGGRSCSRRVRRLSPDCSSPPRPPQQQSCPKNLTRRSRLPRCHNRHRPGAASNTPSPQRLYLTAKPAQVSSLLRHRRQSRPSPALAVRRPPRASRPAAPGACTHPPQSPARPRLAPAAMPCACVPPPESPVRVRSAPQARQVRPDP